MKLNVLCPNDSITDDGIKDMKLDELWILNTNITERGLRNMNLKILHVSDNCVLSNDFIQNMNLKQLYLDDYPLSDECKANMPNTEIIYYDGN